MVDADPPPAVARLQPPMEVPNRNRRLGTCCRRGYSIDRMNLAVRRNSLKSEIQSGQQKNYASCLCVTEFKCRPTFYNFQETQGGKVTIRSEEDKMLPMDLSPRRNDDVDAYVRSFEPNQVQLVGHRTMGLSSQVWEVDHPTLTSPRNHEGWEHPMAVLDVAVLDGQLF
jgi:hypothetical protein